MMTNWKIQVNQFQGSVPVLAFWGNNFLWFYEDLDSGSPADVNFIIENGLRRKDIQRIYGAPSREGDCGDFHVLVYDDTMDLHDKALATLPASGWRSWLARHLPVHVKIPGLDDDLAINMGAMRSGTGTVAGGMASADGPLNPAGHLLYGPYITLPPGSFTLEIGFVCSANATNMFDVTTGTGRTVLAVDRLDPGDPRCDGMARTVSLPFVLSASVNDIEFRSFFGGNGSLRVTSMRLRSE
jgi:hypothetical protein